jgi:hypothetical protein
VLVVWEPMLATDLRSPVHRTLGRIPDKRASQFWDPQHLVSKELVKIAGEHPEQPKPDCCIDNGFFWDEAVLFPPLLKWRQTPTSIFWNGPVVRVTINLEQALQNRP